MAFDFTCPFCNEELSVAEIKEGEICKCPNCGNEIVPGKGGVPAAKEQEEREKKSQEEKKAIKQIIDDSNQRKNFQKSKEEQPVGWLPTILNAFIYLHMIGAIVCIGILLFSFVDTKKFDFYALAFFSVEVSAAALTYAVREFIDRFYFLSYNSGRIVILLEEIIEIFDRNSAK